jgi:hypothetical protein
MRTHLPNKGREVLDLVSNAHEDFVLGHASWVPDVESNGYHSIFCI